MKNNQNINKASKDINIEIIKTIDDIVQQLMDMKNNCEELIANKKMKGGNNVSSSSIKSQMDSINRDIQSIQRDYDREYRNFEDYQKRMNDSQRKLSDYQKKIDDKRKRLDQYQKDYERELAREQKR